LSISVYLFYLLFCLYFVSIYNFFFFLFVAMLLFGHNLHCNCGLHVIGTFNFFEQCILLEIPIFYSCVGLERLNLFDCYFTCTLALGFVGYEI
jgi:hypothetical protein